MKTAIEPAGDSHIMRPEAGRHPSLPVVERFGDAGFKLFLPQSPNFRTNRIILCSNQLKQH